MGTILYKIDPARELKLDMNMLKEILSNNSGQSTLPFMIFKFIIFSFTLEYLQLSMVSITDAYQTPARMVKAT